MASCLVLIAPVWGQVELRGRAEPLEGEVTAVDLAGVTVERIAEPESGATDSRTVSWDRIREVRGEQAPLADAHADVAEQVWRARARIERGDWRLGEPQFDALFQTYSTMDGPTASVVAEGLLRCRLRRGAQTLSVWPWLAWARVHRASYAQQWIGGTIDLPPILDERTLLAPGLAPVFLSGPATRSIADSSEWDLVAGDDEIVSTLALLYRQAARYESGEPITLVSPESTHPGVTLVYAILAARAGDVVQRERARATLAAITTPDDTPDWIRAWCRIGIGRSLIQEDDPAMQRRGVIELLHVPARFDREHPYLAGVALAESAVALAGLGDDESASRLRAELAEAFPRHPAEDWPPLLRLAPLPATTPRSSDDDSPDLPEDDVNNEQTRGDGLPPLGKEPDAHAT